MRVVYFQGSHEYTCQKSCPCVLWLMRDCVANKQTDRHNHRILIYQMNTRPSGGIHLVSRTGVLGVPRCGQSEVNCLAFPVVVKYEYDHLSPLSLIFFYPLDDTEYLNLRSLKSFCQYITNCLSQREVIYTKLKLTDVVFICYK